MNRGPLSIIPHSDFVTLLQLIYNGVAGKYLFNKYHLPFSPENHCKASKLTVPLVNDKLPKKILCQNHLQTVYEVVMSAENTRTIVSNTSMRLSLLSYTCPFFVFV